MTRGSSGSDDRRIRLRRFTASFRHEDNRANRDFSTQDLIQALRKARHWFDKDFDRCCFDAENLRNVRFMENDPFQPQSCSQGEN